MMGVPILLLTAWLAGAVFMAWLWRFAQRRRNAGVVDVAWASLIGLFAGFFAILADGLPQRRLLVGLLGAAWAVRLTIHLLKRISGEPEDGRYAELRKRWGDRAARNFFVFFQAQAFWSILFAVPILVAARAERALDFWDLAGVLIWIIALVGEGTADAQLARFKAAPRNRSRVCQVGLWRYSRHPNYFFEWLHWWSYVLIGFLSPYGWLTLVGPGLMLLFLFKITGIPPTERSALASRGDAYRNYQKTTSVFIPWPPRRTT